MAGGNTIGTGAVVLTANADQLLAGLDKAQAATGKWADATANRVTKSLDRVSDIANQKAYDRLKERGAKLQAYMADVDYTSISAGGGIKGLIGGAAGFAAGAALDGLSRTVHGLMRDIPRIGEIASKYANFGPGVAHGVERANVAFQRMNTAWDEFVIRVGAKLAPVFEIVADKLEVVGFVTGRVFEEIADAVGGAVTEVGKWIDETTGLGITTTSVGNQTFAVLQLVGKGIAYIYDGTKAAAGGILYVCSAIVTGFGEVLKVISDAVLKLADLANQLPRAIRPDWIGDAGRVVQGWGNTVTGVGDRMERIAKNLMNSFGKSSDAVSLFFDKAQKGFAETDRLTQRYGLAGAFAQNSAEAYHVTAQYALTNMQAGLTDTMNPVAVAKQQLAEAKRQTQKLDKITRGFPFTGTLVEVLD